MPEPSLPEESIFAQALELTSAAERAVFLDRACGANPALRAEVEALLRASQKSGDLLDLSENGGATTDLPAREIPGTVFGPYKLLEQIGEGGMGTVWMAEQTEPIQRRVAVKVVKEGMDSKQVLARFEAERQALALMEHPNIAKVLEAGKTPSGCPYFVMELVKGQPITKYCDDKRLGVRDRLELFGDVCRAVQHAHQKGIIHRDLKPSNVLVAPYDGKPVVKVIDFGVAKATGQRLTDKTLFTGFGALVGTPEYMSPEQAEVNNQDIDTRSDIYSLGVLLYELLTGSTPLTRKRIKEVALLEVLRVIREEEPPRPSTRLSATDELPSVAVNRQLEPNKLAKLVRGDLDWIVMRALDKDRNRRYETANGFAMDVQRYLADEPVQASPPSVAYRFRKFARRNKTALAVACLILVCVALLGAVGTWVAFERAMRRAKLSHDSELVLQQAELCLAQGKRADARATLGQADRIASEAPPDAVLNERLAGLRARLEAEEQDEQFLARLEEIQLRVRTQVDVKTNHFALPATVFPEVRENLRRYGIDIGVMTPAQVAARIAGRPEPVRRHVLAALDECLQLAPKDNVKLRQWLFATVNASDDDSWRSRTRKALFEEDWQALAQAARAATISKQPPVFLLHVAVAFPERMKSTRLNFLAVIQAAYPGDLWANILLAQALLHNDQGEEAVRYATAALALRPENAGIYLNLGGAFWKAGKAEAAIAHYRRALALAPQYAAAHYNIGVILGETGRLDDAIDEFRNAIRINKDHVDAHFNLGKTLLDKDRFDDGIAAFNEAIRLNKPEAHCGLGIALAGKGLIDQAIAEYHKTIRLKNDYPDAYYNLGNALRDKGLLDDAIVQYRKAIRLNKAYPEAHYDLANALRDTGRPEDAIVEYHKAIRIKKDYPQAHTNLGNVLLDKPDFDGAIAEFNEAIRTKMSFPEAYIAYNGLGMALKAKGRLAEAIAAHGAAIRMNKNFAAAHYYLGNCFFPERLDDAIAEYSEAVRLNKDYAEAHNNLGNALAAKGETDKAIAEYREALRINKDLPQAHQNLAQALEETGRLEEAILEYREAIRLNKADERAQTQLRQVEQLSRLNKRLPAILAGKDDPKDAGECLAVARLCQPPYRKHYAAAARFFAKAFAFEPKLAEEPRFSHRYNAACAAALAGCGAGEDAVKAKERAGLRRQALDWLRADLDAKRLLLEKDAGKSPILVREMRHWLADPDFAGVRGPALGNLPEAERQPWQQLWDDIADILKRAEERTGSKKK